MNKIRSGDEVIVIAGRDKGKRGTVSRRVDEDHIVVDGINVVKKHVRPNPLKGEVGGIVEKEMPIHVSNVALFNPATQNGMGRSLTRQNIGPTEGGVHRRLIRQCREIGVPRNLLHI